MSPTSSCAKRWVMIVNLGATAMNDQEETITQLRVRLYREARGLPPIEAAKDAEPEVKREGQQPAGDADHKKAD